MAPIRAYELETTVTDGVIRVDPHLEGHRVKVIVLDVADEPGVFPSHQRSALDRLWSQRFPIDRPFVPLSRDEANQRE